MQRLIKSIESHTKGYREIVAPGVLKFLTFARLMLERGGRYSGKTESEEAVLDVFSGIASVTVAAARGGKQLFHTVGGRADVFSGSPAMVYVPPHSSFEVVASSETFDAGFFASPADASALPALLAGPSVVTREVGRDNWQRKVHTALGESFPAQRLLAGETLNPSGNWSSYPPHKHDQSRPPQEARLEEIYFFRIKPAQGFGFIWTYTAPGDAEGFSTVFLVEDGDTVLLPRGYHPVVVAPGYELHYTWVLAGEERHYGLWVEDPRHAWVKNA
jgi:5-deoxy-glucuronate isomerase